ncbi:MAG: recombinase RecB [Candidatus Syntrophoarchaeum caldarius]|uniref:Recombinase RecB n=1 Tax=Candidatus Syntropharchaeum caldarium TaxID=1838285 RepID=A0A1F2P8R1_9EURY|nr:MAG: recombinase RecB [Candidatus Syntrophoarchaeum caldarius]
MEQKRVGLYLRVSTEEQVSTGASLAAQKQKLEEYCKFNEWHIVGEYVDAGLSGGTLNRPQLQRLIEDGKNNLLDVLLVYKLDRLSRSLRDIILTIDELRSYNVDFVSLTEQIDTTTPVGKLMFHIIGAFAEFERDIIRQRVILGMDKKAKDGYVQYKPPFGYRFEDKRLVVVEEEAEIVKDIYRAYLRGNSTVQISRAFNVPRSLVYRILTNKTYLGRVKWGDNLFDGGHEGIVDEKSFQRVSELLKQKRKR